MKDLISKMKQILSISKNETKQFFSGQGKSFELMLRKHFPFSKVIFILDKLLKMRCSSVQEKVHCFT